MAEIVVKTDELVVELSTKEKIGAVRGDITVPLSAIVNIRRESAVRSRVQGFRSPGTHLPGVVALGTWRSRGMKSFVAAYRDEPGYVIDLSGHDLDRVIVSSPLIPGIEDLVG